MKWLGPGSYLAAVGQIDGRINDNPIALLDAAVDLDLPPEVAHHRDLAQVDQAVLHHGDLQAIF